MKALALVLLAAAVLTVFLTVPEGWMPLALLVATFAPLLVVALAARFLGN